jgi:hypothetical protein
VSGKEDKVNHAIFEIPAFRRAPLSCVWVDTGDPARPLACLWIVRRRAQASEMSFERNASADHDGLSISA